MARSLRLEHPGAFWHVYNRGVEKRDIFLEDFHRRKFLEILAATQRRFGWRVHAYALMSNHYHLFVETPTPTLSRGMQKLDGDYAATFNRGQKRNGHLFGGRFKAEVVDSTSYLLELARYIVLNPVRAGIANWPHQWEWSSYRATAGLCAAPPWLHLETILDQFDRRDVSIAASLYRGFVAEGIGQSRSPWEDLRAKLYLGGQEFMERVNAHAAAPKNREHVDVKVIASLVEESMKVRLSPKSGENELARLACVHLARSDTTATLEEVAALLSMSTSGVRKLIGRAGRLILRDGKFRKSVEGVLLLLYG